MSFFAVFCVDYQRLPLPNTSTGDVYYRRQLSFQSFNIHPLGNKFKLFVTRAPGRIKIILSVSFCIIWSTAWSALIVSRSYLPSGASGTLLHGLQQGYDSDQPKIKNWSIGRLDPSICHNTSNTIQIMQSSQDRFQKHGAFLSEHYKPNCPVSMRDICELAFKMMYRIYSRISRKIYDKILT